MEFSNSTTSLLAVGCEEAFFVHQNQPILQNIQFSFSFLARIQKLFFEGNGSSLIDYKYGVHSLLARARVCG